MLILTFLITLTIGIKEGSFLVILSLIMLIYRSTRPHIAECVQIKGTDYFRNKNRYENIEHRDDVLIFRFDVVLANCGILRINEAYQTKRFYSLLYLTRD